MKNFARSLLSIGAVISLSLVTIQGLGCNGDDTQQTDAGNDSGGGGGSDGGTSTPAGTAVIPAPMIPAGQEITYCYYFRFPNTEDILVKSWKSSFSTAGIREVELYTTPTLAKPDGTVDAVRCDIGNAIAQNVPALVYRSQQPEDGWSLPADDGAGKPVAKLIKAGQPAYLRVTYYNSTAVDTRYSAKVSWFTYPSGTQATLAEPFVSYDGNISIPPGGSKTQSINCALPTPGLKFVRTSMIAHMQATHTYVMDGANTVFESTQWDNPGVQEWTSPPFYTFASGTLTSRCDYVNTGSNAQRTITTGPDYQTDETCMETGYFFPATKSWLCYSGWVFLQAPQAGLSAQMANVEQQTLLIRAE